MNKHVYKIMSLTIDFLQESLKKYQSICISQEIKTNSTTATAYEEEKKTARVVT